MNHISLIKNKNKLLRLPLKGAAMFFLWVFVILSGCKKEEYKQDDALLPNGDKLNITYIDTCTIKALTQLEDSLPTKNTSTNLLGHYFDPVFGESTASIFTQIRLSSENVDFGNLAALQIDSVVLSLVYTGYYGGTGAHNVFVHRMTEEIKQDTSYYSNRQFSTETNPIGVLVGAKPNFVDSVQVGVEKWIPHMRIPLYNYVGLDLLNAASGSGTDGFLSKFKGIKISVDTTKNQTIGEGNMLLLSLLHDLSKITVYYKTPKLDSTGEFVNEEFDFYINSLANRHGYFSHSYKNSDVSSVLNDYSKGDNLVYIQAMAGVKTKIEFPYLKNVAESGVIAVTKAELTFSIEDNSGDDYGVPQKLFVVGIDETGKSIVIADQYEDSEHYGGVYDTSNKNYTFNVTRYIQGHMTNMAKGIDKNYGLYVIAGGSVVTANRTVIKGPKHSDNPLQLKLYYSKLN